MKKIILRLLFIVFLSALSTATFAQSKSTDDQKKEFLAKMKQYQAELKLSDEQQEKVKSINTTYFEGLVALKKSDDSKLAKFRQFKSIAETRNNGMKQVLDKEQYKKYQAIEQKIKSELQSGANP